MKRPPWVTTIGVLGIVFATFAILGGANLAISPVMIKMQKEMFRDMRKAVEQDARRIDDLAKKRGEARPRPPFEFFRSFEKMWDLPQWFATWCIIAGIVTMFVAGFYLFSAIHLLRVIPSSITLFYWASGVSIGFSLVKIAVAISASTMASVGMFGCAPIGIIADVILVAIVATSDKMAFERGIDVVDVIEEP